MSPTCFCKPKVDKCPKCSKPDHDKIRPSSGRHDLGSKIFKTRLYLRHTNEAA